MNAVDKAYKRVYSSQTPTSRVVLDKLTSGDKMGAFMDASLTETNWIIVGKIPVSAEELG